MREQPTGSDSSETNDSSSARGPRFPPIDLQDFACPKPIHTCKLCSDITQVLAMGETMSKAEISDFLGNEVSEVLLDYHLNGLITKGHVKQEGTEYFLARDSYIEEAIMKIAAKENNSPKTLDEFLADSALAGISESEVLVALERLRITNCIVLYWQDEHDHLTSSFQAYLRQLEKSEKTPSITEPKEMYKLGLRGASLLNVCGICANPIDDGSVIVETIHDEVNPEGDGYVVSFHPQCYASHLDPSHKQGVGFCHHCGLPLSIKLLKRILMEDASAEDSDWSPPEEIEEDLATRNRLFIAAITKLYDPVSVLLFLNKRTVFKEIINDPSFDDSESVEDAITPDDIDLDWINGAAMAIKRGGWLYHPGCWKEIEESQNHNHRNHPYH